MLGYRTRNVAGTDTACGRCHLYVVVVRRNYEAPDAQRKHVRSEVIALQDADPDEGDDRVHEYTLIPAEVTRYETHAEAEIEASDRRYRGDE